MSAQTSIQRRLLDSSTMGELSGRKRNLVEEMSEFTREGDRVNHTDSHVRLAEELVRSNDRTRYTRIPFGDIIHNNQVGDLCIYGILKYYKAINGLMPYDIFLVFLVC